MVPGLPPMYAPDANSLVHVVRGKLLKESVRPEHELRFWVGHANMLDHLSHVILDADKDRTVKRPKLHNVQPNSSTGKPESLTFSIPWVHQTGSQDGQAPIVSVSAVCSDDSDEESSSESESDEESSSETESDED